MVENQNQSTVEHATIVVERYLDAPPARVFRAYADPKERAQWDLPGQDWTLAELKQDFRVGGEETSRFGPKDDPHIHSKGWFLDIVPDLRVVSAGTMHDRDTRVSSTLFTIEFRPERTGTRLVLTDQSVFFRAGEQPSDRQSGWGEIVDRLEAYLRGK